MYNIRNVFKQEPNAIREAVIAIFGVLVMTGVVNLSAEAVAGVGVVVSLVLGLFYVRPLTTSKDALRELKD
jgi:hypothetical protein